MVGRNCTEQESLWILGAEGVGELSTLSPPLSASSRKSHPSVCSLPEPHEPPGMLTAQTPSRRLPAPFTHLLQNLLTSVITLDSATWNHIDSSLAFFTCHQISSLLDPPLVSLIPPIKSSPCLLPSCFLPCPQTQLLLPGLSILPTLFSAAELVLKFALFYPV